MSTLDCPGTTPTFRIRRASAQSCQGQIQLIIGPMFSGKSTELIRRLKRYEIARYECLIVKYARDVRYDRDGIATHDRMSLSAAGATRLAEMGDRAWGYDVIGVDEGQFFPDVVSFCEEMANAGKVVIVAALDGTFQRKGFPNILELVPLAEHVVKLNAVCMSCFGEGSYTKRMSADQELEVIGGADKYMAACRRCFNSSSSVPASPRMPLKLVDTNGECKKKEEEEEEDPPVKKALFDAGDGAKENSEVANGVH